MTYVDRAIQKLREDYKFHTVKASALERIATPSEGRGPYLHIEIEGPRGLTQEEQTDWLLQFNKWMKEVVQAMDVSITRNNDHWAARGLAAHVVTNKVRNQVPGERWRNMTTEDREKVLAQIESRKKNQTIATPIDRP